MIHKPAAERSFYVARYGPGRVLTIGVAAQANSTALASGGSYLFKVTGGQVHVRTSSQTSAAVAADMLLQAGEFFRVDAGDEAGERYVSMIREGGDATVYVCGTNEAAAGGAWDTQPPTFAVL